MPPITFFEGLRRVTKPKASVRLSGSIAINSAAVEKFELGKEWKYVILGYDKDRRMVALKLLKEQTKGAKKISVTRDNLTASIAGKPFLSYFEIVPPIALTELTRDEGSGCLVFFLPEQK